MLLKILIHIFKYFLLEIKVINMKSLSNVSYSKQKIRNLKSKIVI